MKKSKLLLISLASVLGLTMAACRGNEGYDSDELANAPKLTTQEVANFKKGESKYFETSDGWKNGEPFNVTWSKDNVTYDQEGLKLAITGEKDYKGGEIRTVDTFGYGNYSVRMKPMKAKGSCSSFFIYTGEAFGTTHNEIDIEFLGKNHNQVQFNYFTDGKGGNEGWVDLGFDATEAYHDYGFRWTEDDITWYVDGKPVYKVTENIPMTPGHIYMNAWCGTIKAAGWMGTYEGSSANSIAGYESVSYEKLDGTPYKPSDKIPADPEDVTNLKPIELTFKANASEYIIKNAEDNKSANVTYKGISNADSSYKNIDATLPENLTDATQFAIKVTNNHSEASNVRIDVTDGVPGHIALNKSATQDGKAVKTDLQWGGSFFSVEPNQTIECVITYEGKGTNIVIFLDSFNYQDESSYDGDITLKDYRIGAKGGEVIPPTPDPDPDPNPDTPVDPEIPDVPGVNLNFTTDSNYKITNHGKGSTITYEGIKGNSYNTIYNCFEGDVTNTISITLKLRNNAAKLAHIRIDMQADPSVGLEKNFINTSATMDGVAVRTDMEWGGSFFDVPANSEVEAVINYDIGKCKAMVVFLDSMMGTEDLSSGSLSIYGVNFTEGEVTPPTPDPDPDPTPTTYETLDFTSSETKYVITNEGTSSTITYEGIKANTYATIYTPFNHDVLATDEMSLTLKNNADTLVHIRIDVQADPSLGLEKNFINTSATMDGKTVRTDMEWGGSFFDVPANSEVTATIKYQVNKCKAMVIFLDSMMGTEDVSNGNVTIKNVSLKTSTPEPEKPDGKIETVNFTTDAPEYVITNEGTSSTVVYTDIKANTYKVICHTLAEINTSATSLKLKIKNNAETLSHIRVDVMNSENKCINTSATMNNEAVRTDMEWGGSFFDVNQNNEVSCEICFPAGSVHQIVIFIDSMMGTEVLSSGNVTFSSFSFQ